LSRRSNWEKGAERDNEERTLLKQKWIRSIQAGEVIVEGVDILEKIKKSKTKDDKVIKAIEEIFLFFFFSFLLGYFTEAWERMSHMCDVTVTSHVMSQVTGSHSSVGN